MNLPPSQFSLVIAFCVIHPPGPLILSNSNLVGLLGIYLGSRNQLLLTSTRSFAIQTAWATTPSAFHSFGRARHTTSFMKIVNTRHFKFPSLLLFPGEFSRETANGMMIGHGCMWCSCSNLPFPGSLDLGGSRRILYLVIVLTLHIQLLEIHSAVQKARR